MKRRFIKLSFCLLCLCMIISCNSTSHKKSTENSTEDLTETELNISYNENGQRVMEVSSSELELRINTFGDTRNIIFKVEGNMSNYDYSRVLEIINRKTMDMNWLRYIGLDLSQVTGLTKISDTASLITLVIPDSVYEFGELATLDNVIISENNQNFLFEDGVLYSKDKTVLYLYSRKKEDTFEIPRTVTKVWAYSFSNNSYIRNISIPASVVFIGTDAFRNRYIQSLRFESKDNWIAHHNYYNTDINVSAEDLQNVQNYQISTITHEGELLNNSELFKADYKLMIEEQKAIAFANANNNQDNSYHQDNIDNPNNSSDMEILSLPSEAFYKRLSVKSIDEGVEITIDLKDLQDSPDNDGWLVERNSGILIQYLKKDIVTIVYPFTTPGEPVAFCFPGADYSVEIMPVSGIGNPMKQAFYEIKPDAFYNSKKKEFTGYIYTSARVASDFFDIDYILTHNYSVYFDFYVRVVKNGSTSAAYAGIGFNNPKELLSPLFSEGRDVYYIFDSIKNSEFKTDFYNHMDLVEGDLFYAAVQARYTNQQGINFYISGPESIKKAIK